MLKKQNISNQNEVRETILRGITAMERLVGATEGDRTIKNRNGQIDLQYGEESNIRPRKSKRTSHESD